MYKNTIKNKSKLCAHLLLGLFMSAAIVYSAGCAKNVKQNTITDKMIKEAIVRRINNEAISVKAMNIIVERHVVTLHGIVSNLLVKEKVENITESVKGVQAVENKLSLSLGTDVAAVKKEVKQKIANDPVLKDYPIKAALTGRAVYLTGKVPSWAVKSLAGNVVKGVKGVDMVINTIKINLDFYRDDADLKRIIASRLKNNAYVYDELLNVAVDDGIVELNGAVGSLAEKRIAGNAAWVAGAKDVKNNLEIKLWLYDKMKRKQSKKDIPDDKIEKIVKKMFIADPRVHKNIDSIKISVDDGAVSLVGVVGDRMTKNAAESKARGVVGVVSVNNYLTIQ